MPTINLNDENIFYAQHGDSNGLPIIFIHGAGGSYARWWNAVTPVERVNAIGLDLPAHGQSTGKGRDNIAAYAAVTLAFLDALHWSSAVIAGHSMGGAIALWLALHQPARVRGLVLAGTGARLRVHPDILQAAKEGRPVSSAAVLGGNSQPPAAPPPNPTPPEVVYGDWVACDTFSVMERMGEIKCPTLVIVGDKDQMTPLKYASFMAERIAGAQMVVIPGAGHSTMSDKPREVAAAMQKFVDGFKKQ